MSCPICQNKEYESIDKLCSNLEIMGKAFPKSEAELVSCTRCGLTYLRSAATQRHYLAYYDSDVSRAPKYREMFGEAGSDEYFRTIYEHISKYMKGRTEILDIAGSWGELGSFLREKAEDAVVTVVDASKKCISSIQDSGLNAVYGDASELAGITDKKYDMIIINHSLEHILNISSLMKGVFDRLREDGHVYIEVPDIEGYTKYSKAPYSFLTYEHVVHMSLQDLENLASLYGFEILESGSYYKKVSSYPSVWVVMKRGDTRKGVLKKSGDADVMREYFMRCRAQIQEKLSGLQESQRKLVLWGIGASTALLLGEFARCNVIQLIDRNPLRQGIEYKIGERTFRIQDPQQVADREAAIFILSVPYKNSIEKQIREMGLENPVICF